MDERKKSKFEEELAKLLATPQLPDDPLTQRILEYPKKDSFGNVSEVYPSRNNPFVDDNNRYTFVGDNTSPGNGHEERRPGIWPVLAKEGEPAYEDPGLVLRSAAISGKNRQERNKEAAKGQLYRDIENLRNALNPETHEREMRGVPAGHRAGLMNLNRAQYISDMEESAAAPGIVLKEKEAEANANSPEAEYNRNENYIAGADKKLKGLEIKRNRLREKLETLKAIRNLDVAGDQMWEVAKLDYLNNGDRTGLENIMGRIQSDIQRKFTESEAKKNRQNTLDVAKLNKQEQDAAKKQDLEDAAERAADVYNALQRRLSLIAKDDSRYAEIKDQVETAKILMKQAYRKAGKLSEYNEIMTKPAEKDDKTLGDRKTILFRMYNAANDKEFLDAYNAGNAEQRKNMEHDAEVLSIPLSNLGVTATKAVANIKNEQKANAKKKKDDFKNNNVNKTFAINILTKKAKDTQAWTDFEKSAKNAGWTVELQPNGTIIWK